jgi:Protein of unknown function (DUF2933)
MRELLIIALVLACPLMMVLMMRGGHSHGHMHGEILPDPKSTAELRRRRDELERQIEERKSEEETPTPVGDGCR